MQGQKNKGVLKGVIMVLDHEILSEETCENAWILEGCTGHLRMSKQNTID